MLFFWYSVHCGFSVMSLLILVKLHQRICFFSVDLITCYNNTIHNPMSFNINKPKRKKQNRAAKQLLQASTVSQRTSSSLSHKKYQNSNFLTQVNKILKDSKEASNVINLEFHKQSDKPEVEMVYVNPNDLPRRLQKLNTRINVNKYQMIIQVRKNPFENASIQNQGCKDQIENKNYKSIYQQIFNNQKEPVQIDFIENSAITLYEPDAGNQKKDKNHGKKKNFENIQKAIQEKILQNRANEKRSWSEDDMKRKPNNVPSKLEKMYEKLAVQSNLFHRKNIPKPEQIVYDRFQNKFYRSKQQKYEDIFDRKIDDEKFLFDTIPTNNSAELEDQPPMIKLKKKHQKVPEHLHNIYRAQNIMIRKHEDNGKLSQENAKKLLMQFNKTIFQLRNCNPKVKPPPVSREGSRALIRRSPKMTPKDLKVV